MIFLSNEKRKSKNKSRFPVNRTKSTDHKGFFKEKSLSESEDNSTIFLSLINNSNVYRYKNLVNSSRLINGIQSSNGQQNSKYFLINNENKNYDSSSNELIKNIKIKEKPKNQIILIVDDNQIINFSNKNVVNSIIPLFNLNFDFILCSDGLDILKHISDDDKCELIKIIITDENMEFMSGSDAIKIVRSIEKRNKNIKTKIISLTCHEDLKILERIRQSGADYVLTKPLRF